MIWVIPEKLRRSELDSVRENTMLIKIICQTHNIFRRRNIAALAMWSAVTCHRFGLFGVPPSGGRVNAELQTKAPSPLRFAGALQNHVCFTNFIATPFMQYRSPVG